MSEIDSASKGAGNRKILENPFVGSLVVPIAIVLVGALIIFGVTKMLSTERGYKDLVREMHSKTFGNRWIAAYELSKVISSSQIPKEDVPWLIDNLSDVYKKSVDPRTKRFIVATMGALRSEKGLPLIEQAIEETDPELQFHAIASLGNIPTPAQFNWLKVIKLLQSEDLALKQAVVLTLGTHMVTEAEPRIIELLKSESLSIRFSAATALIPFKSDVALSTLEQILKLTIEDQKLFNAKQISGLKLNILYSAKKHKWEKLIPMIGDVAASDRDLHVAGVARDVLNQLKN